MRYLVFRELLSDNLKISISQLIERLNIGFYVVSALAPI